MRDHRKLGAAGAHHIYIYTMNLLLLTKAQHSDANMNNLAYDTYIHGVNTPRVGGGNAVPGPLGERHSLYPFLELCYIV